MRRALAFVLLAAAFVRPAWALFDDDEARKRIGLLRPQVEAQNRSFDERLSKIEQLAVSAMQGFLVTYPTSALAPNAQYWIGMAHSGQRDYKSAIAAQRKLLTSWPDSQKAPDAMLSIASAQETMGDRKSAQKTLEDLVGKYPTSSAATSAKQRLAAFTRR